MESETKTREGFERYLLGVMSEEEYAEVESLLLDDGPYEEFKATEQDLIDRYVRGEMNARQQRLFETNYMDASPERLKRVAVARAVVNLLPALASRHAPKEEKAAAATSFFNLLLDFINKHKPHRVYALPALLVFISVVFVTYVVLSSRRELAERRRTEEQLRARLDEVTALARGHGEEINKLREALAANNSRVEDEIGRLQRERETLAKQRNQNTDEVPVPQLLQLSPFTGTAGSEDEQPPKFNIRGELVRLRLSLPPGGAGGLPTQYTIILNGKPRPKPVRVRNTQRGAFVELRVPSTLLVEGVNRVVLEAGEGHAPVGYALRVSK